MTSTPRILGRLAAADGTGVVTMQDTFESSTSDVWAALTDPVRLGVWMGDITGDLRLDGEFRARFFASGWEGTGRVAACEHRRHLLLVTRMLDKADEQVMEMTLTADGDRTRLVWEERGMPAEALPFYGAGIQVHVEDLGAYLRGRARCDAQARFDELLPSYQEMPPGTA